jgi:hypothetical protein
MTIPFASHKLHTLISAVSATADDKKAAGGYYRRDCRKSPVCLSVLGGPTPGGRPEQFF